jgi:fibronectin-binding autotransporter adhesin
MCKLYNWIKRFLMSKINNTTAYVPTAPTATTILIGSEIADGATRNYLVSALATYMSSNITTLTDLTLSGFLTVEGLTTFNDEVTATSTLGVTGATTLSSTLDVTGATTLSSTLGVTGATTLSSTLGVTGATTLSSTLGVTGATTLSSTLGVTGATILSSSLGVGGNATVTGTLGVTGATAMTTAQVNSLTVVSTAIMALSAFDDDAAAGGGGLTTGRLYQTTGAGAAPLNAAGIVMVKQ